MTYQPLGKYWAFPLAERLAERLCPTPGPAQRRDPGRGGPDARGGRGASPPARPAGGGRAAIALALALALVLDTADGRLARLQGTSSAFGRWLDQVLDELADLALHAAIAWAAFARDGRPVWLLLGIVYASGKYLFLVQSILGDELERRASYADRLAGSVGRRTRSVGPRGLAAVVRLIGHADVRWHLWIVLAALGPARRRAGGLRGLLPGPGPGRRGQEGGALCLSPASPS